MRLAFELEPIDLATLAQLVRQLADRWPFLSFRLAAAPPRCRLDVEGRDGAAATSRAPCSASSAPDVQTQQVAEGPTGQAHVAGLVPLVASLLATLWVSAIALVGIVFLFTRRPGPRAEAFLLSFAAGVLLATTFLELIPEAVERGRQDGNIFAAALVAMIGFFFLERVLHGFHVHEESHAVPSRYLILVGDGVHNFIDGVAIAASFAASPRARVSPRRSRSRCTRCRRRSPTSAS